MDGRRIDEGLVRRLIKKAAPDVVVREFRYFGEGWDNVLFLVNRKLVVRVARDDLYSDMLLREAALLSAIGSRLPVRVPRPEIVHEPDEDLPLAAFGYRLIEGMPLADATVNEDSMASLTEELSRFLNVMHALTQDAGLPQDLPRFNPPEWLEQHDDLVRDVEPALRQQLRSETFERVATWWREYTHSEDALAFSPCLIHGDLAAEHILVDESRSHVTGVIDFGDAMIADPALDLAGLPESLAREVLNRLSNIGDREVAWKRRDAYRRFVPLHAVRAGWLRDDESLLAEGFAGLETRFNS